MKDKISSITSTILEFVLLVVFIMVVLIGFIALLGIFLVSIVLLFYGSSNGILFSLLGLFLLSVAIAILLCVLNYFD